MTVFDPVDPRLGGRRVRRVVADAEMIAQRVRALGSEITAAYPDGDLLVIGVLKGSLVFLADLVREIRRPLMLDFLVVSSYGADTTSSGTVAFRYDPASDLRDTRVLLVEDIVDTGATLSRVVSALQSRLPRSLDVCALLHKRHAGMDTPVVRFTGFDAPDEFVVGYGLDHAEAFRHLPYIVSLE